MNNIFEFKRLIYPHLNPNFKQKKELKFIYCYNFRFNGDENPIDNGDLNKYLKIAQPKHMRSELIAQIETLRTHVGASATNAYRARDEKQALKDHEQLKI